MLPNRVIIHPYNLSTKKLFIQHYMIMREGTGGLNLCEKLFYKQRINQSIGIFKNRSLQL